jgi:flagellar L-ring protein precursor FlgH
MKNHFALNHRRIGKTDAQRSQALFVVIVCLSVLSACASAGLPDSGVVQGPLTAPPVPRPTNLERVNTGSIFQPGMATVSLFSSDRKPRYVGDTLKIDISESLSATSKVNTDTSRDSKLASKGPGAKAGLGIFSSIMNLDATASGSNSFKGDGTTENASKFTGQLAASVINVLPNGNLVVAGDRAISLNGGVSVLRFSGIVNPRDIRAGNIVASSDAVNARLEVAGRGEVSDAASRSWIQRVLADSLSFW